MDHALIDIANYLWSQSWQIAAVFAVVAVLSLALRKASAHWRYLLWMVVLVKCVTPPLLTVPVAVLPNAGPPAGRQAAAATPARPAASPKPARPSAPKVPAVEAARPGARAPVAIAPSTAAAAVATVPWTVRHWAGAGWIVGAAAFILVFLLKAWRTHRRLRKASRPADRYLQSEVDELAGRLGLRRAPPVRCADGVPQPFVWGLLRGSVYLPSDYGDLTTALQRRSVLAHELAHVARWDAAANVTQTFVQAAMFFHPLVWWANRRIRREREKCCDEAAIAAIAAPPEQYSASLVDCLAARNGTGRATPSLAVAGPTRNIEERIRTIMNRKTRFHRRPTRAAIAVCALLAAVAGPTALVLTARGQGAGFAASGEARRPAPGFVAARRKKTEMVPCLRKYSTMLVVGADRMTFQGKDVTWEQLPAALEKLSHRDLTIFAVGFTKEAEGTEKSRRTTLARVSRLRRRFGMAGVSYVGRHELGDKGEAYYEPVLSPAEMDTRRAKAAEAAKGLLGVWTGVVVDKPEDGIPLDLLTIALAVGEDGKLKCTASGRFVSGKRQAVDEFRIKGDRIEMTVRHRTGDWVGGTLRLDGKTLRGVFATEGNDQDDRCDVILRRSPVAQQGLPGLWYGLAVDKPGQGSSVDVIVMDLHGTGSKAKAALYGRFCKQSAQKSAKLRAEDDEVAFELVHRTGMKMAVSLKMKDGKLVGDAVPIDPENDSCDITLHRARVGAKELPPSVNSKWNPGERDGFQPGSRRNPIYKRLDGRPHDTTGVAER